MLVTIDGGTLEQCSSYKRLILILIKLVASIVPHQLQQLCQRCTSFSFHLSPTRVFKIQARFIVQTPLSIPPELVSSSNSFSNFVLLMNPSVRLSLLSFVAYTCIIYLHDYLLLFFSFFSGFTVYFCVIIFHIYCIII